VTSGGESIVGTDSGGALVVRRVRVVVSRGADRGTERMLAEGTLVVGSGPSADLVLADRRVSRVHAELALDVTGVRVRDLGSRNGTYVGETRVEAAVVQPRASIRLGDTTLDLQSADVPSQVDPDRTRFGAMVAASGAMRRVLGVLERVAASDVPVLIEGETGVGKTVAAEALHRASRRAGRPMQVLDLSTSPGPEAVRGAFASAVGSSLVIEGLDLAPGRVAAAIARALDDRDAGALDVRTIATSRQDARSLLQLGALRRDVYFGLAGVHVVIPPLRERREDVRGLVRHLAATLGAGGFGLSARDLEPLRAHAFPGNVRQLRRIVEEAVTSERATRDAAPSRRPDAAQYKQQKERLVSAFEREYVRDLLERHDGNLSRAAAEAGLGRNHLLEMARKHGVR
jgi:DNA-binding NtrC family response regulator